MLITVAPLRAQDRDRWSVLARAYKIFYETALSDAEYDSTWQRLLAGTEIHGLGAHMDGRLVGIVHFLFHANIWTPAVCYLQDLYVDASARGKGAARALIAAVADATQARGAARLYWHTRHDNATARMLYDRVATHRGFIRYEHPLT